MAKIYFTLLLFFTCLGCSSKKLLQSSVEDFKDVNVEFSEMVKVDEIPSPVPSKKAPQTPPAKTVTVKKSDKSQKSGIKKISPPVKSINKNIQDKKGVSTLQKLIPRQPELEDGEGFIGRRPIKDPFIVGEEVVLSMKYFNVVAGTMTLETLAFKTVNGKKAYHFSAKLISSKVFSMFYALNDLAETFVDFETLEPITMNIKVHESSQIKDMRSFFDTKENKAVQWYQKVDKEGVETKKKQSWDIEPFSQNVISSPFYIRAFQLKVGKKISFRVADEGKNLVFSGEVLRKEVLKTKVGSIKTIVVKPEVTLAGALKPVGDIMMWLTDDDQKLIVRIESKIKIGTIIGELQSLKRK